MKSAEHGRCGESAAAVTVSDSHEICALPHGHPGWHRADGGMEWVTSETWRLANPAMRTGVRLDAVAAAIYLADDDDPRGMSFRQQESSVQARYRLMARAAIHQVQYEQMRPIEPRSHAFRRFLKTVRRG